MTPCPTVIRCPKSSHPLVKTGCVTEEEMRKFDECDMEEFGRLEGNDKTIAVLGDGWRPQTANQDGDRISKQLLCSVWKKRNERPSVGGASICSRNGARSRKGCVFNNPSNK